MPRCKNCDGHVTRRFARVFGDNEDDVYRCRGCATSMDLYHNGNVPPEEDASAGTDERPTHSADTWYPDDDWS